MSELSRAAAAWFARRRARLNEQDQAAFEAWLAEDIDHGFAYAEAERAWEVAAVAFADPRARCDVRGSARRHRAFASGALAAGLALAVFGGGGLWALNVATGVKPLATKTFHTDVGQRSTVTLPDGSVVTLNTDTVVRTRADGERRLVYLDRGQAFFQVAKDRRHPFVVAAAGRTVTAVGTAFDVRVDGRQLKVVLVEGKVRVEAPPAHPVSGDVRAHSAPGARTATDSLATEMLAGSELVAPPDAGWRLTRADTVRETSWVRGQLIFDDEPLGDVVAELNRYSDQKMVIDDPALAARTLSGAFKPGDVQGFARSLETYGYAYVSAEDRRTLHFTPINRSEKSSRG